MTQHSPAFLALVDEARTRVREIGAADFARLVAQGALLHLIDVREESEFAAGHVAGAQWIGKGIIERDIEHYHPDRETPLYLYCGGGFRSVLAADNLRRMGYRNVYSVDGGWRVLKDLLPQARRS